MKKAIYWFRNNLRLRDNPSLVQCLEENDMVIPVIILHRRSDSRRGVGFGDMGPFRRKFLVESINGLSQSITEAGSHLHILFGDAPAELQSLANRYQCDTVYTCRETAHAEVLEELELRDHLTLKTHWDQLIIDPAFHFPSLDHLPDVFGQFRRKVEKRLEVRAEAPLVTRLPGFEPLVEDDTLPNASDTETDPRAAFPFQGGEVSAWQRMEHYLWSTRKLSYYKKTRNGLLGPDYSTKLSAFLALGCISPVSIYHQVKKYEREIAANQSTYWVIFELLWREFFKLTSLKHGKRIFHLTGIRDQSRDWENDPEKLDRWRMGQTGDAFVDANMKELLLTGFMSNRGRQNAASFLAHDWNVDWRLGARWFESQLIDYDCDSNWGNWMYVAGVGNDSRNKKFDTKWQADRYDPNGKYRSRWNTLL